MTDQPPAKTFSVHDDRDRSMREILSGIFSLREGYDPSQLVSYILETLPISPTIRPTR